MRLKRHESGRKSGVRNYKGRGGSARAKQIRKRNKRLLNKLKNGSGRFLFEV